MIETSALVAMLRDVGTDLSVVDVKAAAGGLSKTVVATLSAFANTVFLGLEEQSGFPPAPGFKAGPIRDALVTVRPASLTPALRAPIDIEEFEGASVQRADIQELDPLEKPCFITARGEYQGSFIRSGDGDTHLAHYEVSQLLGNQTQPLFDIEPVERATLDDLDSNLVDDLVRRGRCRSPRTFAKLDTTTALILLGATSPPCQAESVMRVSVGHRRSRRSEVCSSRMRWSTRYRR
ncbi:ATP-binding protein [Rhodococcus sp. BP-149]|uniref:AlbA family DNA-binding domain-containing protein n=1 Tax=unclassified Rhodococcus (in: high G+C Gram-positive bacteria) TaxID=192944 RepID=UPI001C9A9F5A|nr:MULTISPECIES: hypothetical protein [unclassified Rhodococcus (in: high G+C Gram-positive bacteria)]MBY6685143.1 ATP-binding protein [Rhodococcus sp. BP-288]MBY6692373.1 ATP-binding protein [Rhodococcus sp. BP-188]MBY6698271.1 ATP-binding protein [Rhodococcus sp. BP-285]MBY6700951.1 ATP-binding protein [Rhodococcus sp. BP-283]MBY6711951.1 ATP-binding protein [Rhodococcus sp. BP-160]